MKSLRQIGVAFGASLLFLAVADGGLARAQSRPQLLASTENPIVVVRAVRTLSQPDGPVIEVIADRPLVPVITKLENPARLVVDLPNARFPEVKKRVAFRSSEIQGVRVNQFRESPPITRIVVDLSRPVSYTWDAAGNL